jgi:hypothetical protein
MKNYKSPGIDQFCRTDQAKGTNYALRSTFGIRRIATAVERIYYYTYLQEQ